MLTDWWAVDLLESDGSLRRLISYSRAHRDLAAQLEGWYLPWRDAEDGPFAILRTGRTTLYPKVQNPMQIALSPDPTHLAVLQQIDPATAICTPIRFSGQVLGAMTFGRRSIPFRPIHVALARTLAARTGQGVYHGRMYQQLQNANRRKDEYLAILGHELRNPLGAISNAVAILQSGQLTRDSEPSVLAIVGRQVQHLTKLVGDLLDVSRLTSGKITLQPVPTDLYAVAERCLATLRSTGKDAQHDIQLEGNSATVVGDPVRLEQVLDNLVDNAVKYTPPGGRITVSIALNGRQAVLRVRDTGVGVPHELLPRMFDLFTQGGREPERRQGGLGVGLAIVRGIVDLHGGAVHASSAGPGTGTEVIVELPLVAGTTATSPEVPTVPSRQRRRRILVVEDNADARETLRLLLELNGHEVHLAADGGTGVALALETRPEVALIDLGLPDVDGWEIARRVRAAPEGARIRLVALTGYGQPHDRRRAGKAGFDAYLVKPVDRESLEAVLQGSEHSPPRGRQSLPVTRVGQTPDTTGVGRRA